MADVQLPDLSMGVNTLDPDKGSSDEDYSDHLTMLVRNFELSENMTREARELSERDKDYVHNIQYTADELAIYRKRKQPPLTINKTKAKVQTMLGLERRMRSDPKAFPRNPVDEKGAEAATDALRFIGDQNNFNEVRSLVYEDMVISGYGGCDVVVERTKNDESKIVLRHVPFERLGADPHSLKSDFSDAKWKFIVIWKDKEDAIEGYPGREDAIEGTLATSNGDVYQDTPRDNLWCDNKRTRIRVVQMHYLSDGEWMIATFTRGGFLIDPVVSPYIDSDGDSACSLHMRSMFIDRNGNRYGAVRDLISLQDEFNKRRSKALHLLNVRQTYANRKGVQDVQRFKSEISKPDGHVEITNDAEQGKDFGIFPTGDMASGQMELLQQVANEFQAYGANAALAGTDPRDQSGRAQQLQQQAGQVTLETGMDGLRMFSRSVYEACWLCVKVYWDAEKWVRITDDERNIKWVGLNKKVTLQDKLEQMFGIPIEEWSQQQQQQASQLAGIQSPYDPKLQQVVDVENDVSGIDVDVNIEEGPDLSSLQSEQFETLANLAKSGIAIPPKAIIMASSIRNKDVILDEMENGGAPSPQIQAQMKQMQEQLQQAQQQLQEANQKAQMQAVQLANKEGQLQLENQRLSLEAERNQIDNIKAQASIAQATKPTNLEHPLIGSAEIQNLMADTAEKQASAEQTRIETELMQQTPPPSFTGSVGA